MKRKSSRDSDHMLERTMYGPDGQVEKVERYRMNHSADARQYADEMRKAERKVDRHPLSTFRVLGKDYEPKGVE